MTSRRATLAARVTTTEYRFDMDEASRNITVSLGLFILPVR
jgi:hypothetical protein